MMRGTFLVETPQATALRALNYTPEIERFRQKSRTRETRFLGVLLESLGPAYGQVFTRLDCTPEHGVELLSQSDMFATEPTGRVIRQDSMPEPTRHLVKKWQILVAGAGTLGETELYGRSIIADGRLVGKYVGPHAMVLTFKEPELDLSLYTYAFLCTELGVRAFRSASYGTKVLGIRKDILANLPIPVPDEAIQTRVARLVRQAVAARETYLAELQAARRVLEALPDVQEASELSLARHARCLAWDGPLPTLSAWTYASTGGALGLLQKRWQGRLADAVVPGGIFNGPRFTRIPVLPPHGIEFMSQRDVFLIKPVARRIRHPGVPDDQLFVQQGNLLIGGHGTLGEGEIFGRVEYATARLARNAFSQDVLRVQVREEFQAAAYGYLSTHLGLRLLRSTAVGTKILSMRPDLLAVLPFPDLPPQMSASVGRHVQAAVCARDEGMEAEAEAVRIVEQEVLLAWLA
jgi:hypothetical protein